MLELTVVGSSALLKVAVTVVPTATPVAPLAGLWPVTVGGVVPVDVVKTTSTQ